MDESVYEAPKSDLSTTNQIEIPEDISKKIKHSWIAAVISGVITLGVMLIAMNTGMMGELFDIWTTVDVALIFLLAFGIYKKSRFAATFMFAYFLLAKLWFIFETGEPSGLLVSLIFLLFLLSGNGGYISVPKTDQISLQYNVAQDLSTGSINGGRAFTRIKPTTYA